MSKNNIEGFGESKKRQMGSDTTEERDLNVD
jgi:hypothetical protein